MNAILVETNKTPAEIEELVLKLAIVLNDNIIEFSNVYKLETGVIPILALEVVQNQVLQTVKQQQAVLMKKDNVPHLPNFQKGEA